MGPYMQDRQAWESDEGGGNATQCQAGSVSVRELISLRSPPPKSSTAACSRLLAAAAREITLGCCVAMPGKLSF